MNPDSKIPLISRLKKTRNEPKILGRGLETRHGENVTSFKVEGVGELLSYVEKPLKSEKAARETIEMYNQLSLLGLPVVQFLKIVKTREVHTEQDQYSVAMEDLSAHGQNLVLKVGDMMEDPENPGNKLDSQVLLEKSKNAQDLVEQMARALAVLHNNGIYEFHNQVSFFIITDRSEDGRKAGGYELDFKILDYSNFTKVGSENSLKQDTLSSNVPGFERGVEYNLENLKNGLGSLAVELEQQYNKYRTEKLMVYNFPSRTV